MASTLLRPHYPIVIAGAGPTGLTLANLLGVYGVDCLVLERNASTVHEPRAVSIDDESLRTMQAIGLADAIEIYTINSARAMGLDAVTGSLAPGKSADIIVLDQNVFDVPSDRIAGTKVLTTYFEGRPVYQR